MILIHTPSAKEVAAYLDLFRAALPQHRFISLDEMTAPEAVGMAGAVSTIRVAAEVGACLVTGACGLCCYN